MAIGAGEILLGLGLLALSKKGPEVASDKPRDKSVDAGGVDVGGLVGVGTGIASTAVGLLGGGGAAGGTVVTTTAGTTAAGTSGAKGIAALTGNALVAATMVAVVILVVWVALLMGIAVSMISAAGARALRAQLGAAGMRLSLRGRIRHRETELAKEMIQKLGGTFVAEPVDGIEYGAGMHYYRIQPYSAWVPAPYDLGTLVAIDSLARYLAVEQIRALNRSVLTYFQRDYGWTEAQISSSGDAITEADFDSMVANIYAQEIHGVSGTNLEGQTWSAVNSQVNSKPELVKVAAQARFSGQESARVYVHWAQTQLGFHFSKGITQADVAAAAAANPPGNNQVAYINRVFGLGQEQKAAILYDDAAELAWLPLHSGVNQGGLKLFPYSTKPYITDPMTGS